MAIKFGCIGDSGIDAYRGTDARGGTYATVTYNPIELLTRLRDFDLGAWGTYAEPRRTDYAYNWARSAATSHTMISQGQHTGLAAQIQAGLVEYALVKIGANDFNSGYESLYDEVYAGTLAGAALTAEINSCIADVLTGLDALRSAGALGVVCQLFPYTPNDSAIAQGWTDATGRQRVLDAIAAINTGLTSGFVSRNIPYTSPNQLVDTQLWLQGTFGSRTWEYWGETVQADAVGDEPHHLVLADAVHSGTLLSAIIANYMIVAPLNARYNLGIKPLRPWEVLREAGISVSSPVGSVRRA